MKTFVTLTVLLLVGLTTVGQDAPKREDIFNDKQVAIEVSKLRQISETNKAKVRSALDALHYAVLTASVSTDKEEISRDGLKASRAIDAAEIVIPNGVLKGSLISSDKAIGHSFLLRLINSGDMDPKDPGVAPALEQIILRYDLVGVPSYERPAKALAFAKVSLGVADGVAFRAGIITKLPK